MKYFIWALRIIIGCLFIFSGLIKANDPLGLTYKMNEFFEVWHMSYMIKYTLFMSVCMIATEMITGIAMLVGNYFRLYSTLLLLLNIFFLFLTGYALFSGKIKECGCFGDCIKLSPSATFYKDVVLTAVSLVLFIYRYRVFPLFQKAAINFSIVAAMVVFAFGLQWYTLTHLPINWPGAPLNLFHDCLPYKPGNNIWEKMQHAPDATAPIYKTTFVYEKNGIEKTFDETNYPWQDTTWKIVASKTQTVLVKEGTGQPEIHDFSLTDSNNNDQTEAILRAKGYTFIWFLRDPETSKNVNMDRLHNLIAKSAAMHIPFYAACSGDREVCRTYQEVWTMKEVPFMIIDGTVSKTALRTNPGLMLLKDGVVEKKWSYLDYPKDMILENGNLDLK